MKRVGQIRRDIGSVQYSISWDLSPNPAGAERSHRGIDGAMCEAMANVLKITGTKEHL